MCSVQECNQIPYSVPFITDALSSQVLDCVGKTELDDLVGVVQIPPANLNAQLVRNRLCDGAFATLYSPRLLFDSGRKAEVKLFYI